MRRSAGCWLLFALAALATIAVGCNTGRSRVGSSTSGVPSFPCESTRAYRDYVNDLADWALRAGIPHQVPKHEAVTISLRLAADGSVRSASVHKATSEQVAAWGLAVVRKASPFPRPWYDLRACVVDRPLLLVLVSLGPEESGPDE